MQPNTVQADAKEANNNITWQWLPVFVVGLGLVHWASPYGWPVALINTLAALFVGSAIVWASIQREGLYQRLGWRLIGIGVLCSTLGHLGWYAQDLGMIAPPPIITYLLYLPTYLLLISGIWVLGRRVETQEGAFIDALMLTVSAIVLFWAAMVEPAFEHLGENITALFVVSLYPIADLLLLMVALKLYFLTDERAKALLMVVGAVAFLLIGDVLHAMAIASGLYAAGGALDIPWYLAYALIVSAAWHPTATESFTHRTGAAEHPFKRLLAIGFVSIAVPTTILLTANDNDELVRVAATISIVLFALMLIRMSLLIRRNREQAAALERMIRTDPMTGLANRRWLMERLRLEVARAQRERAPLVVGYLDLDHFKRFNDTHGHGAGDALLIETASRWQQEIRDTDLLARAGGEEFVVICPNTPIGAARQVMDRLRAAVPHGQTCSIGLAQYTAGDTSFTLLERADRGLYGAKAKGRNCLVHQEGGG